MLNIFIRTIFIYLMLEGIMRLMGKRQIGELEVSELITTLLLSELAALPIANSDIPLMHAVIPIITLLFLEMTSSLLLSRFPACKNWLTPRPGVLIRHGEPDIRTIKSHRISMEELIIALRQNQITDIRDVEYAILEQNGRISVIPRGCARPATTKEAKITPNDTGISHILISQGHINRHNMQLLQLCDADLQKILKANGCTLRQVCLLTQDDSGGIYLLRQPPENKKGGKILS